MEQVLTTPVRKALHSVNTPTSSRVYKQAKRRSLVETPVPKTPLRGLRFSTDSPPLIYSDENKTAEVTVATTASPQEKLEKAHKDIADKDALILQLQQQLEQLHRTPQPPEQGPLEMAEGAAASSEKEPSRTLPDIPTIAISPCSGGESEGPGFNSHEEDTDETINLVNMPSMFVPCYPNNEVNNFDYEEEDTMQILNQASDFVRETLGEAAPPQEGWERSCQESVSTADGTKCDTKGEGQDSVAFSVGRYVNSVISQAVATVLEDQLQSSQEPAGDEIVSDEELSESSPCRNLRDIAAELQADLSYSSPFLRATADRTVSKVGRSHPPSAGRAPPTTDTETADVPSADKATEEPPVPDKPAADVTHSAATFDGVRAPSSPSTLPATISTVDDEAPSSPSTHTADTPTVDDDDIEAFVEDVLNSASKQLLSSPGSAPCRDLHGIAAQLQADLSFSSPIHQSVGSQKTPKDSDSAATSKQNMEVAVNLNHATTIIDNAFQFLHNQDQHITMETAAMATTESHLASTETVGEDTVNKPSATPKKFADSSTVTSPLATVTKETEMTPKNRSTVATATTPASVVTKATATSPVATVAKETEMTPTKFCDIGTATTPPPALVTIATGTTPVRQVAMETMMTPVRVIEEGTATTPGLVPHTTTGTAMTPGETAQPEDVETVDISTRDDASLRRHAQTLAISNELLRHEIVTLNQDRDKLSQSVSTLKQRLENSDTDLRAEVARLKTEKDAVKSELQNSAEQLRETQQQLEDSQRLVQNMSKTMQQGEESLKTQEEQAASIGRLQRKNNQLEEDLLRAYRQHKEEILQVTQEKERYRVRLENNQEEMLELEEDLQVYINLLEEMETDKNKQATNTTINTECTTYLEEMAGHVQTAQEGLLHERQELTQLRDECDRRKKELDEQEQTMVRENKRLKVLAEDSERKESETNELLFSAMSQVSDLTADVDILTVAENEARERLRETTARYKALQRESEEHKAEMVGLQAALSLQEGEIESLQKRLRDSESKLNKMNGQLDAEFERFGQEMQAGSADLQAANQERDQLRHDLENCLSIVEENQRVAKQQKLQLEEKAQIQAELYKCKEQLENNEAQYKEQLAFHEAERNAQSESLRETEEALSQETEKAQKFQKQCEERQTALETLEGDFHELKAKLSETLEELDSIKTSAHHMLLQQGQEMKATQEQLGATRGRLEGLVNTVQGKEAEKMPAVAMATPARSAPSKPSLVTPSRSLVSSIMYAVRETVLGTPSPRPAVDDTASTEEPGTTQVDEPENCSEEKPGKEKDPDQSEQGLVAQAQAVGNLVTRILGMLTDLQAENATLKRKLSRIQQGHDDTVHDLTSDLMQSEQREEKLHVELNLKREELQAAQQALEYSRAKVTQMSENMGSLADTQATCKRQAAELDKLSRTLRSREEETRLLREELESALGQRGGGSEFRGRSEVTLVRERISLKAEVNDLRLKLMDKEEEMNQVLTTTNRRMKAHEENQQKAETEVGRLDNIIEAIRQTLHKHEDVISMCDDLTDLLKDLDGDDTD